MWISWLHFWLKYFNFLIGIINMMHVYKYTKLKNRNSMYGDHQVTQFGVKLEILADGIFLWNFEIDANLMTHGKTDLSLENKGLVLKHVFDFIQGSIRFLYWFLNEIQPTLVTTMIIFYVFLLFAIRKFRSI